MNSLALGQAPFISVAGSTIHASTCKRHCNRSLNGCRSKSQAYQRVNNNETISQHSLSNHTGAAKHEWRMDVLMRNPSLCEGADSTCTAVVVIYLRHIRWSQTPPGRSLAGRHRCIHQVEEDTGDCTHSYKGWKLMTSESESNTVSKIKVFWEIS